MYSVEEVEEAESFADRLRYGHASPEVAERVEALTLNDPIAYDGFYIFETE